MKIGKVLILVMSIWCLFIGSMYSVSAADEEEIIEDPEGDVFDIMSEDLVTTNEKPNIDIKRVAYSKTDGSKKVTMVLEVYGVIEDKGNIENLDTLEVIITYVIGLVTTDGLSTYSYEITYINKNCTISHSESLEPQNITDFEVDGGTLTIFFDLINANEIYEEMTIQVLEFNLTGDGFGYYDIAPDEPMSVGAGGPYGGEAGDDIEFSGIAYLGMPPYTYEWDFGDDETATGKNPVHSYEAAGNYTVTLTVTDDAGSTANDTTLVSITKGDAPPSNGGNGIDSGLLLFVAVIAIIAIIGIIVIIFIVRR